MTQFCDLVDDLTNRLVANGVGYVKGFKATSSKGTYGRYLLIHGRPNYLCFSAPMWAAHYATPIWLRIYGPDWKPDMVLMKHLSYLEIPGGVRLIPTSEGMNVPIVVAIGVERDRILELAEEQITFLFDHLKTLALGLSDAIALLPPHDTDDS